MPWAKLDDSIWRNEKLLEVTPAARWLYVAAIAFCRSEETAGEITRKRMTFLVGGQGLKASHVAELVKAGLLDDIDYGYAVHDYEHFNPLTSTERVRKHRRNAPAPVTETQAETPGARSPRAGAGAHRVSQFPNPVPVEGDLSPKQRLSSTDPENRLERLFEWAEPKGSGFTNDPQGTLSISRLAVPIDELIAELQRIWDRQPEDQKPRTWGYFWRPLQDFESAYLKKRPAVVALMRETAI